MLVDVGCESRLSCELGVSAALAEANAFRALPLGSRDPLRVCALSREGASRAEQQ